MAKRALTLLQLTAAVLPAACAAARGGRAAQPASAAAVPCDNDGDCYKTVQWRCLQTTEAAGGRACTLDYAFNETGFCACGNTGSEGVCAPGARGEA